MIARRLLLIHAHPDDETIGCGATMARYAAEGAAVTLLTCTLGELGEILVPELEGLAVDRADQLGGYRIGELRDAMRALGVADHRFLGGAGRWRDSGMIDTEGNKDPRAFWHCDADPDSFTEAVDQAVAVIREVRPQVMITYDRQGGYGHPDHIMAHRVAMAAAHKSAYGEDPWPIAKIYWTAGPEEATTALDGRAWLGAKRDALRAHATQVVVDGDTFALSNRIDRDLTGIEYYRLVSGEPGELDAAGLEADLFAGVTG